MGGNGVSDISAGAGEGVGEVVNGAGLTSVHHHGIEPRPASCHPHSVPPDPFPEMLVC